MHFCKLFDYGYYCENLQLLVMLLCLNFKYLWSFQTDFCVIKYLSSKGNVSERNEHFINEAIEYPTSSTYYES